MNEWWALGPLALGVCAAALFAGGLAKGAVGIGLPLVSVPLIAVFVPVPKALVLLAVPLFVTNVWQCLHGGYNVEGLRRGWVVALALSVAALVYSVILDDVERHRAELSEKVKYEVESLTPAVTEQAVIGDYALIQQILDARVGQRDIALVGWIDNVGNALSASSPKEESIAPMWFVRWADIRS